MLVHVLFFPLGKVICPHHIFRHRHLKVSSSLWWKLDSVLIGRNIYPQPVLPLDSHFPFLMNSLLSHFVPFQMRSQLKASEQAIKQASKQARSNQAGRKVGRQASWQASRQAGKQAGNQEGKQARRQVGRQASKH